MLEKPEKRLWSSTGIAYFRLALILPFILLILTWQFLSAKTAYAGVNIWTWTGVSGIMWQ